MIKYNKLKLKILLSIILLLNINSFTQTITSSVAEELVRLNINPNNYNQLSDSLGSNSLKLRSLIYSYCREKEILFLHPVLLQQLTSKTFDSNYPYPYSFSERANILHTLIVLKDSSIKDELREAIFVMKDDSLNIFELQIFSNYLMKVFNDEFGWQYIKPYYIRGSSELFGIDVYYLKDFLNSSVRNEVINVLRNLALTDYRAENRITAIEYLTDINDEEVVNMISQASVNDPEKMNRFLARECLKKISYELYLDLLKSALETETEYRLFIYDGLLKSGQPSIYKYVIDLYKSNEYPLDKSLIEDELENQWLLQPKDNVAVTVLLDSLSSAVNQLHTFGWIGNQNFIQLLNTYLFNCKNYYQSNDTITSSNQLRLFRTIIDRELRDSTNLIDEFVNQDAWNFLYPQSLFIQQKINSKSLSDSLISLTPASIQAGGSNFNLSIRGTSFNSQSEVYWNGYPLATYFVSDSIVQANVPASNIQVPDDSITISVFNPIIGIINELNFKITSAQQNPNLVVNLKNSLGNQIPASNVTYYENSWKDAINNGDGTFTVITTRPTVSIRVFYEYASLQADNVTAQNNTYTFTTVNAAVQLKNSLGNLIDQGTIQYYAGAWRTFGTTSNGVAYKELLPINYSFRMTYEFGNIDKQQNLSVDPTVVFQTVNAVVQLKNSLGNLIDAGTVQYYAGAWRSFGTTSNGVAFKELLPINYSFRMTYEYGSIDKQQNLSVDPTVVFQTVNAAVQLKNSLGNLIDAGTVQYYAGAWRSFGSTSNGVAYKELLPINYSFRMTYEYVSKDKQQNLSTNPVVDFNTVLCSVKVSKTSNNQPISNATVKYYAGAWRNLGTTNSDGITTKELLPANISFRATSGSVSVDKQQDISVNNLVEILLNIP